MGRRERRRPSCGTLRAFADNGLSIGEHQIIKKGDILAGYVRTIETGYKGQLRRSNRLARYPDGKKRGVVLYCSARSRKLPDVGAHYEISDCEVPLGYRLKWEKVDPTSVSLRK